jgi:glutamine synthetase
MLREELIFVGTCDIAAQVRGKGSPARELPARKKQGIGWTHSNMMQTAFGPILDTPFGTGGDLMVVPDMSAEARVDFADCSAPEHFILGDIRKTDGSPWECCPREFAPRHRRARLESELHLIAAFEQEFIYTGVRIGPATAPARWRQRPAARRARAAGLKPDTFLPDMARGSTRSPLSQRRHLRPRIRR